MESIGPPSYQCRGCGKVFRSTCALRGHMSSGKCRPHVADEICQRKAEASTNAQNMESTDPPNYQCRSCGKIFQCRCALGGHMSKGKCRPNVADEICPRKAEASTNAQKMESTHPPSYQCGGCGKVFQSTCALGGHMSSGKCRPHVADKIRPRKAEASTNAQNMESIGPPNYQCRSCGKIFQSTCALGGHMSSGKCRPHVADEICPRKAEALTNAHNVPRKFHCRRCGKGFDTPQLLGGHTPRCIMSLTGTERLHCKHCRKDFTTSQTLGGHTKGCNPKVPPNSTRQEKEQKITREWEPSADNSNYKRPKLSPFSVEQGFVPEIEHNMEEPCYALEQNSTSIERLENIMPGFDIRDLQQVDTKTGECGEPSGRDQDVMIFGQNMEDFTRQS